MKFSKTTLLLLLFATALITLLSCCSWLYPVQPYDDANWYMAIGKSMLHGKLLYTEVHDQKGPLLFFLHAGAAALSQRSFLGIYLIEVLCCFAFLKLSYRTMRLFAGHGICLLTTCVVGLLTYSSDFFYWGDTVEELSLPILLFVLYRTLRYAKLGQLPGAGESVGIGVGLAAVFWMKFTVLAMCVGALAALLILAYRRSQMLLLLQVLTWVVVGAGLLTAAVLLYFVWHGNEADLYHSYFYFNIFLYTGAGKVDASAAWWPMKWGGWLLMTCFVMTRRVQRDTKLAVAFSLGAGLLTFVIFKVYTYYFLTIFVFAPLLIYFTRRIRSRLLLAAGSLAVSAVALATNFNLMTLLSGHFPQAVLSLAATVNADADPDKEVLTVNSYDTGIYTQTDCLPPIRFFSTPNAYVEELVREQTDYLESCRAKYLVRKDNGFVNYYGDFHPDLQKDYDLIQEASDDYRPELLLHPLEYLWTLGYMRNFVERLHTPEHRLVTYSLYRLRGAEAEHFNREGLIGSWSMTDRDGTRYELSFSRHNLVCQKVFGQDGKADGKYYSFSLQGDRLRLSHMYMGDEYRTVPLAGQSPRKLVLLGWPHRGRCTFDRQ